MGNVIVKVMLAMIISINIANAEESLRGDINNQYGIRNDILQFIQSKIPVQNRNAMKAAITIAQQEQSLYYNETSDIEAYQISEKINLAIHCLDKEYKDKKVEAYVIYKEIQNMIENNEQRFNKKWDVIDKHFANKNYSFKQYTNEELDIICERGSY